MNICQACKHGQSYHRTRGCAFAVSWTKDADPIPQRCGCQEFIARPKPRPVLSGATAARMRGLRKAAIRNKGAAYRARNLALVALSVAWESHLCPNRHKGMACRWILCVHSPAGHLCWMLADEELDLFGHLERSDESDWDGTGNTERDARIKSLPKP